MPKVTVLIHVTHIDLLALLSRTVAIKVRERKFAALYIYFTELKIFITLKTEQPLRYGCLFVGCPLWFQTP